MKASGHTRRTMLCSLAVLLCAGAAPGAGRLVQTAYGPVLAPLHPQRVVTLDAAGRIALHHGLTPLATTEIAPDGLTPPQAATAARVPLIGSSTYDGQLRFERMLAMRPDLIVGMIRSSGNYDALHARLSRIAPTVLLRAQGAAGLMEVSLRLAEAMGLSAPAHADREAYRARIAALRDRFGAVLARVPLAAITGQDRQVIVYSARSWAGRVLGDLGARLPTIAGGDGNGTFIAWDRIPALAEAGGLLIPADKGAPAPDIAPVLSLPIFARLPAARAGAIAPIRNLWPETYADGLALLDDIEPLLHRLKDTA